MERKYSKLEPISRTTLSKYVTRLYTEVLQEMQSLLPPSFGLMYDGWKHGPTSTEYVGIFAWVAKDHRPILLGMVPFKYENDEEESGILDTRRVLLGADNYECIISTILSAFGREFQNIDFVVADNAEVNSRLSRQNDVPMIGCYSHRLALEIKLFLEPFKPLLEKIDALFTTMRTVKCAMILKHLTSLKPVKRNTTRWSSTFEMLKRYLRFLELDVFARFDSHIRRMLPSPDEDRTASLLFFDLQKMELFTQRLQTQGLNLLSGQRIFDLFHTEFPDLTHYTARTSEIVNAPVLNQL
ncbi:hypothetical protein GEMRC1_003446 [Eukaryota sp. GEM-RC1]